MREPRPTKLRLSRLSPYLGAYEVLTPGIYRKQGPPRSGRTIRAGAAANRQRQTANRKRLTANLLVVSRCIRERIVEAMAILVRGVCKSVEVFFDINRFEEEPFVPNRLGVFDQNSGGAIDAPHPKSGPKKSAVRIKLFQVRHRMETIDRDLIFASKAVIGFVFDSSSVEQQFPFHTKIKRRFFDLVGSPHADGTFFIQRDLQGLIQPEVSPDDDRTFVPCRKNAAAEAIEHAHRINTKIVRHPADGKCFKISVLELASSESRYEPGLFFITEHADHGYERVRKPRMIPPPLESERNNKIAVLGIYALSQSCCNLVLDAVDDLLE